MLMSNVVVKESDIVRAAGEGMDAFVKLFVDAIKNEIGGELNAGNMGELNAQQTTLLAWDILHEEVMDGGFVQLIYNGYGRFFFRNPFGRAMRQWGVDGLATLMNRARPIYEKHHDEIELELSDDEFMALFERFPKFDDCDDDFVEHEEDWTEAIAHYIDEHIDDFVTVEK